MRHRTTFARLHVTAALVVLAAPAVGLAAGTVTGIGANPAPATAGTEVAVTVTATGPCQVYVDFGDKTKAAHLSQYPATVKHVYAAAGKYVLRTFAYTSGNEAPGLSRCGGFADMELVVNPKPATRALAPHRAAQPGGATTGGQVGMTVQKVAVPQPGAQDARAARLAPIPTPTKAAN